MQLSGLASRYCFGSFPSTHAASLFQLCLLVRQDTDSDLSEDEISDIFDQHNEPKSSAHAPESVQPAGNGRLAATASIATPASDDVVDSDQKRG